MADAYKVDGMTCGGCARSVSNAITKAAPDAVVTVDLATGTVLVDGDIPVELVQQAVEAAGFDFCGPAA
ncbi:heavy metal transporter [Azospirillum sp. TSH100]|uniref:heavy-metal-associated domain-containing protein n=1 Tax=Azospirillum sp. TSH100 TaxID=652764 RepID=UPI000D61198B|nr:heavy metal-associated domain-containing protein [Azospirillum sp. TSH100]PWC87829.1 heavy metal transporter [Azospirillum sp. TSH100]QCG88226.1 heavy-metal-associated domain-containing protein [Azospirillum sp. TSH100]